MSDQSRTFAPEHAASGGGKPVLLVSRRIPPAAEARARRDYDVRLNDSDEPYAAAELLRRAEGADAVIVTPADKVDAGTIGRLPESVRAFATFSVGYDHVDAGALRERGIPFVNTPDVLSQATAELAVLLILAACRRAGEGERLVRAGGWRGWAPTMMMGIQVSGAKLGIMGMGRIGREVARMARGFEMQIHYRDLVKLPESLVGDAVFHGDDDSFLAECEILSLNAPGGAGTASWFDAAKIAKLPQGAVVVNTARGTLVDDAALIAALKSGRVAAAGLDVFAGEPNLNPGYLELENAVLLPHLGSNPLKTREAMGTLVLDGLDAIFAGREPANLVK